MAVVDADYKFIYAECGTNGMVSDGGIWRETNFVKNFESLNAPKINQANGLNYALIGDSAFALQPNFMKPFSKNDEISCRRCRIFNYRLCRARRVVENAFGILSSRFRVLLTTMNLSIENVNRVVMACIILHNLLRASSSSSSGYLYNDVDRENINTGRFVQGAWRLNRPSTILDSINSSRSSNRYTDDAKVARQRFMDYFNGEGAVGFQDRMISH